MKPTLLVLAAGMGSRYGGLKQMDPMGPNGETVLDYSVFDAIRAGFGKVVFIIRKDFEDAFKAGVGSRFAGKIDVDYAFQQLTDLPAGHTPPEGREKPWGTSHAVWAARNQVQGNFAVINADDFYGANAYEVAASFFASANQADAKDHYAMVGYRIENTLSDHGDVNRGNCQTDAHGHLAGVEEVVKIKRQADGSIRGTGLNGEEVTIAEGTPVSMNFWAFTPKFFTQLEEHLTEFLAKHGNEAKSECYIPTVVDELIAHGKADCAVLDTTSSWFGVTYPDDKPFVVESIKKLIDQGAYPQALN